MDKKSLLSIIVPTYNEERIISASIEKLHGFLSSHLDCPWEIVVADNGSRDGTLSWPSAGKSAGRAGCAS